MRTLTIFILAIGFGLIGFSIGSTTSQDRQPLRHLPGFWIGFDPATGHKIGAINNTPFNFTVLDPVRITNENIWLLPVRDRQ